MDYFAEGIFTIIDDFTTYCKEVDDNFDEKFVRSLIRQFLQSRNICPSSDSQSETDGHIVPVKKILTKNKQQTKSTTIKNVSKEPNDLSIDDFNKLTVEDMENTKWVNKTKVSTLKSLCKSLKIPCSNMTKSKIIEALINYKNSQDDSSETNSVVEDDIPIQRPKRRTISAAIPQPKEIKVTTKHGLELVHCDTDENIYFVLNENGQVCSFISKECFDNNNDNPEIKQLTTETIRFAKTMGIGYIVPEVLN